jgi:hypothetical protein
MSERDCPNCQARGHGGSAELGTAWSCDRCGGSGKLKAFKRIRRTARTWSASVRTFPGVPEVRSADGEFIGDVACVFDDGINVEHHDGNLWSFYKWSEVPNADDIKAAWQAIRAVTAQPVAE